MYNATICLHIVYVARLCIQINLHEPIIATFELDGKVQQVIYEYYLLQL